MTIRPKDYCPYQKVDKKLTNEIKKVTEILKN